MGYSNNWAISLWLNRTLLGTFVSVDWKLRFKFSSICGCVKKISTVALSLGTLKALTFTCEKGNIWNWTILKKNVNLAIVVQRKTVYNDSKTTLYISKEGGKSPWAFEMAYVAFLKLAMKKHPFLEQNNTMDAVLMI